MKNTEDAKLVQKQILKAPIMIKFRLYGFFKNLRFFEPYLLILLITWGLNLFQIGILMLIQEVVTYLFELPSGILADKYGKKTELLLCFIFYIGSFIIYFFALGDVLNSFFILALAPALFGLGEAFRSGTHKAMILSWMDRNNFIDYKSFVYGRTRSWSLLGSALNGVLSIFLIIFAPEPRWVFPFAIVPYLADFILIATYPSYMNEKNVGEGKSYWQEFIQGFKDLIVALKGRKLRQGIFSSSSYDAIYKSLKDYIQPIVKLFIALMIINLGLSSVQLEQDTLVKIMLGAIYTIFYLASSLSSKNAYRLKELFNGSKRTMDYLYYFFAGILVLNAIFIWVELPIIVVFLYLFIYIFENFRRPITVDYLGTIMKKEQRATILSAESQLKAIMVLIFAPIFGLIADYSIPLLFVILAILMVFANLFFLSDHSLVIADKRKAKKVKSENDK
ncbi:MAG: MFS transporter [Candidatus Heimdallarchaeaceae archaeon]